MSGKSNVVIWIGLFALVAFALIWGAPMLFSLVPQTHLTIHLSPTQTVYAPNQQVTVSGTLTCSGVCPNAALAYSGMDVQLSGSWGWSSIAETNAGGVYSVQVNMPSSPNSYQISAVFYQNGSPSASATVSFSVNANAIVTTTTTSQSQSISQTSIHQTSQTATTTQATTSTVQSTSQEVSTYYTTSYTTIGSTTSGLSGVENWFQSSSQIGGYDVPNLLIAAVGIIAVVILVFWRRGRD